MSTENGRKDTRKAMAYDLLDILEEPPDKTYTVEEMRKSSKRILPGMKTNYVRAGIPALF